MSVLTPDGSTRATPTDRIRQVRVRVPFLMRPLALAGGLGYGALAGFLNGVGAAFGGFGIGMVALSWIGRATPVYVAVP